ncbi:MAG: uncharacterized protein JWN52_2356 [Actinomycetia bacterium]|nr:uncharacterized protein [Actinomycetes bacterium]
MRRMIPRLVLTAISSLLLALLVATGAQAAPATAVFAKTSTWDSGYQAQYTITNGTTTTISSWNVAFDFPSGTSFGSYWDALLTSSGNHHTFRNREYNGTIAPGQSVAFGFVVSGTGSPANCTLNGASCSGGTPGPDTSPPTVPTGLTAGSPTGSTLQVSWNASTDDVGVTGYDLSRNGGTPTTVTGTGTTVTGLSPNTTYRFKVRARDAAGNTSAYTAEVSGTTNNTTPPPPGSGFSAPYVDMGAWPTPSLTAMSAASGLKSFTLAFITASGCKAMWFNAYDPRQAWAKDQIDAIRAAGGDVKISFGGASGVELAQACTDVTSLYNEYNAVVNAYALQHIDLDIEGAAVADPVSVTRRSQALARLQQTHPDLKVSLTLPVLPTGLDNNGFATLKAAHDAGVNLDVVNVMAMDYNQSSGDYGDKALQAAQSTFDQIKSLWPSKTDAQLWRMVGVTPMLGQNDDGGIYNQDDARQLVTYAKGKHLGVLAFWEMTRDRNACTGPLYNCTNVPQSPYEFSKIFAGFTG